MNKKMVECKSCGAQIAKSAKTCPHCGARNKRHKVLGIVLAFLGVCLIVGAIGGESEPASAQTPPPPVESSVEQEVAEPISYTAYYVEEMVDDLSSNPLRAEEKYNDQYVEVTGRLAVIDSDGRYISLLSKNDPFAILGVQCRITTDEQKAQIIDMAIGDTVTVQGQITDVGEIISYMLDIDSIVD